MRRYTDTQLATAVAEARSWRGVLRALGLAATSASAMRSVRAHADRLALDYSHFTGQRRWTDRQLTEAIASASSWAQVAQHLGLAGGSSTATMRGHAVRLGLDTAHLGRTGASHPVHGELVPQLGKLRRAGPLMAAAWFEFCGHPVSWPLEPCRYDLVVWRADRAQRVQVKTSTVRAGSSWTAWLSTTGRERTPYDPEEIDEFFVISGDLEYYLIPVATVGGRQAITLSSYEQYRLIREIG